MKFGIANIRGIEVYVTDVRVGSNVNKRSDLYHYQIRHSDEDWGEPCTIEPSVLVNHYGDIVSKESLDHLFDTRTHWIQLQLENNDVEEIYRALSGANIEYKEI